MRERESESVEGKSERESERKYAVSNNTQISKLLVEKYSIS